MSKTTLERYGVNKDFHLSALGRTLNAGDVIEIQQANTILRVNGGMAGHGAHIVAVEEAIRVVIAVAGKDTSILERLPEIDTTHTPHTQTLTAFPVIGCLKAAEEWLGSKLDWTTVNDDQEEFIELFYESGMAAIPILGDELKRMANKDIAPINEWLAENGFSVRLSRDPGPGGFAVASILDVLVEWMQKGSRRKVTNEKGTFDGVFLDQDQGVGILQNAHIHNHPVVRIATKSGDRVYMTPVDGLPQGRFALESKIRTLTATLEHYDYRYEGVVFPMVNYDREIDMSFLQGLNTQTVAPGFFCTEAVQQTKFRMNEQGARVESAMAMNFAMGCQGGRPPFIIDQPFLLWIMREGISMPLFGGIFAEDVWSDPENLD